MSIDNSVPPEPEAPSGKGKAVLITLAVTALLAGAVLVPIGLFVADLMWIRYSAKEPRVLDVNPSEERAKENAPTQW